MVLLIQTISMNTLLHLKEIYLQAFRNIGNLILKRYLEFFAWFSFILFVVVVYAFIFRLTTGFAFD